MLFRSHVVKIIHCDECHKPIIRYIKFRTLKQAKYACEYISKYHNVICEIVK